MMRDKTPMCFIFGEQDRASKNDSETVFKMMSGTDDGRPRSTSSTSSSRSAGPTWPARPCSARPALNVPETVTKYCQKIMADRKAIPWTEVKPEANPLAIVPLGQFGIPMPRD